MRARVKGVEGLLPELVRVARTIHQRDVEIRLAVLLAWTGLAGVCGWKPGMVRAVEREMRKHANAGG
jgi:hypothetical protein